MGVNCGLRGFGMFLTQQRKRILLFVKAVLKQQQKIADHRKPQNFRSSQNWRKIQAVQGMRGDSEKFHIGEISVVN